MGIILLQVTSKYLFVDVEATILWLFFWFLWERSHALWGIYEVQPKYIWSWTSIEM